MNRNNPAEVTPATIETLLTVDDLAHLVKRSPRTIRYWRSKGLLPKPDVVVQRTVRWRPQTVEAWLANGARPNN